MNKFQIFALKSIRKAYKIIVGFEKQNKPGCIQDAEVASKIIMKH